MLFLVKCKFGSCLTITEHLQCGQRRLESRHPRHLEAYIPKTKQNLINRDTLGVCHATTEAQIGELRVKGHPGWPTTSELEEARRDPPAEPSERAWPC